MSIKAAYEAITALRQSLNLEKGIDIAESLNKLYNFLGHQLTLANLNDDVEILEIVVTTLEDMKETWKKAFDQEDKPNRGDN